MAVRKPGDRRKRQYGRQWASAPEDLITMPLSRFKKLANPKPEIVFEKGRSVGFRDRRKGPVDRRQSERRQKVSREGEKKRRADTPNFNPKRKRGRERRKNQ